MRVRDVMTPDPFTVGEIDTLYTAASRMAERNCRRLPVLDRDRQLIGILTDRDIRLAVNSPLVLRERWQDDMLLKNTIVEACMTPDPITVAPDAPLIEAVELMLRYKIGGLPVVEGRHVVGIVTVNDLLQALQVLLEAED